MVDVTSVDGPRCGSCGERLDRSPRAGCGDPRELEAWPQEIEMANGPNIVAHSQAEADTIRMLMLVNAAASAQKASA